MITIESSSQRAIRQRPSKTRPEFPAVILYQDHFTAIRAMEMYRQVARHFESEFTLTCEVWRFDVLQLPILKQNAGNQLTQARLILCSAHEGFQPAPEFQLWLESLLQKRTDSDCAIAAMIASLGGTKNLSDPFRCFLQELAHKSGMMFFSAAYPAQRPQAHIPGLEAPAPIIWRSRFGVRQPA